MGVDRRRQQRRAGRVTDAFAYAELDEILRGAIPGERVRVWIERAEKRMAYAVTREVIEASPDRRFPAARR